MQKHVASPGRKLAVRIAIVGAIWFFLACCLVFFSARAEAQQGLTNTFNVAQFQGGTVGAKLTNAQAQCLADTRIQCILLLDPVLSVFPTGTMPTLCGNCTWLDYRAGFGSTAPLNLGTALPSNPGTVESVFFNPSAGSFDSFMSGTGATNYGPTNLTPTVAIQNFVSSINPVGLLVTLQSNTIPSGPIGGYGVYFASFYKNLGGKQSQGLEVDHYIADSTTPNASNSSAIFADLVVQGGTGNYTSILASFAGGNVHLGTGNITNSIAFNALGTAVTNGGTITNAIGFAATNQADKGTGFSAGFYANPQTNTSGHGYGFLSDPSNNDKLGILTTAAVTGLDCVSNGSCNAGANHNFFIIGSNHFRAGSVTVYSDISSASTATRNVTLPDQAGNVTLQTCATSQKAETGADTGLLTCSTLAAVGTYRVCISMAVSAQSSATLGWTATWTDSNGSAQAPTNLALNQTGVAAPALTFTAATNGNYSACQNVDLNSSGTNIVVKTTFSGTSIAYKASATVERIQ